MLTLEMLNNWVLYKTQSNTLLLGLIQYEFNYSEELSLEQIQKEDLKPLQPTPIEISKINTFIVAPLLSEVLQKGRVIDVELHEKLIFCNTSPQIVSLYADFGEGKSFTFRKGSKYSLSYQSAGTKIIRFVGKMSDGSEKTTYARLIVEDNNVANRTFDIPPCFVRNGTNRVKSLAPFTPYEPELFPPPAEVEVGYYYAAGKSCQGQQALTKPILIIDGFDPGDKRSIGSIYSENLLISNSTDNLGNSLRSLGYDIVIANFPKYFAGMGIDGPLYRDGGADYIERNAMGHIEVIRLLNQELQQANSSEQLVVIGPSMGGLISRYALAYMEKHNVPHNTRLWVSFDSPHNGANISIGAQEFLRYWGGQGSAGAQERHTTNK